MRSVDDPAARAKLSGVSPRTTRASSRTKLRVPDSASRQCRSTESYTTRRRVTNISSANDSPAFKPVSHGFYSVYSTRVLIRSSGSGRRSCRWRAQVASLHYPKQLGPVPCRLHLDHYEEVVPDPGTVPLGCLHGRAPRQVADCRFDFGPGQLCPLVQQVTPLVRAIPIPTKRDFHRDDDQHGLCDDLFIEPVAPLSR